MLMFRVLIKKGNTTFWQYALPWTEIAIAKAKPSSSIEQWFLHNTMLSHIYE